jgi:hypothetical protein
MARPPEVFGFCRGSPHNICANILKVPRDMHGTHAYIFLFFPDLLVGRDVRAGAVSVFHGSPHNVHAVVCLVFLGWLSDTPAFFCLVFLGSRHNIPADVFKLFRSLRCTICAAVF